MSSVPSPEFSDSLDSTITWNQYADNDENYNNDKHYFDRQLLSEENNDKYQVQRKCTEKTCSTNNSKTVSIDPGPKLLGNNQSVHKIKDSALDNSSSKEKKTNDVRRVASSDSIPRSGYNNITLNEGCRVLSQDCVRKSNNSGGRNTIPLRYIKSAKGTWTFNF